MGFILALLSELGIQCCCELWCESEMRSDPTLLWLWCRPAAAALIPPLAREPPYAAGAAIKKTQKKQTTLGELKLLNNSINY